ncbi:sodium- and chloride-dependent glycine transporter 1-like [Haemaphysalis longicornis]
MLRLESNLAQFAGDGNRGIFSTVPLFIGVGYSMTVYAVTHAVADMVPLSDSLALLLLWTKTFDWHRDCPGGWMSQNSSCYAIKRGSTPCKLARSQVTSGSQHVARSEGLPVASGSRVSLVHPSAYTVVAQNCIPDLQTSVPPYDFRRERDWVPSSYELRRTAPMYVVAGVWLMVFAIAHRGFFRIKKFFYTMVILHVVSAVMLLFRAATLTGALRGLRILTHSDWSSAGNLEMWSHALYISLESVGISGTIYLALERFNHFKNQFKEDVIFVLAADTATKSIGAVTAFLCLGYLSHHTGMDIHMLVDTDSNFVVSITSQALSLTSYSEFWSYVHSLWLVSTMLPKFLIVPDIIIELLSASHTVILVRKRCVHFLVCSMLLIFSIGSSISGGPKVLSVIAAHQNFIRLFLLALESAIILQFYGSRRLGVDSKLMTGGQPGLFVTFCWTSAIPITCIVILWAKLMQQPIPEKRHPFWLHVLVIWLDVVELSFIPVFAIVILYWTKLSMSDSLVPLPTWQPVNWEHCMQYRQTMTAQVLDRKRSEAALKANEGAAVAAPPQPPAKQLSPTHTTSDALGTHIILSVEAAIIPTNSDWRYDSSAEDDGQPPVKFRSAPGEGGSAGPLPPSVSPHLWSDVERLNPGCCDPFSESSVPQVPQSWTQAGELPFGSETLFPEIGGVAAAPGGARQVPAATTTSTAPQLLPRVVKPASLKRQEGSSTSSASSGSRSSVETQKSGAVPGAIGAGTRRKEKAEGASSTSGTAGSVSREGGQPRKARSGKRSGTSSATRKASRGSTGAP